MNAITLPRSVLEQALEALESGIQYDYHGNPYSDNDAARCVASDALRAALEQPQVEQEPAPNGATHRQPKQGAFYKRVDGKWYVWSRMENGEPHRWYISPGTSESCLEPLNAAAPQPPAVKDSLTAEQPQSVTDCHQSQPQVEQESVAWQSIEAMAVQRYKVVPAHDSMFYRHAVVAGDGTQQLYIGRETECENIARRFAGAFLDGAYEASLYTQPQNLSCKSNQARLATLWGYVKEQPPRQPLTREEIAFIAAACGGLASDFVVSVARAIEAAHGVKGRK